MTCRDDVSGYNLAVSPEIEALSRRERSGSLLLKP
jgi:hypothetical protein